MIIVHYREIALKGKNRIDFERKLRGNIKDCLKKNNIEFIQVKRSRGRITIETDQECPQLSKVFGISHFSYSKECKQDLDIIKQEALKLYTEGTFCVRCKRSDKNFKPSNELEQEIGGYIVEHTGAKVKLKEPDITIYIEIANNKAYIFTDKIKGPGGLPLGTDSHVILLLQNKDSINAGLMVMKRGCSLDIIKEKDIDYSKLFEYEYGIRINELEKMPDNPEAVIVSDRLGSLKEYPYFVLRPLI